MVSPLVRVLAPLARVAGQLAEHQDAVTLISSFLDRSSQFTLAQAAATGSLRLLDRVMEIYTSSPDSQQRALRIDAFTRAMASAVEAHDLAMVQCLHQRHPGRLGFTVLQQAAASDSVEILQWLLENRAVDDHRWSAPYASPDEQHTQRGIVVMEILWMHARAGYRVCRWLFESGFPVDPTSVVGKAMDKGDLAFLQSLPPATRGHVWFCQSHLHSAIRQRQCEIAVGLSGTIGLRPDFRHARIAWVAAMPGMEPYIPLEARLKMTLVEALSSPYRQASDLLRLSYSIQDAAAITSDCSRRAYLQDCVARRRDDDFKWLVTHCGWSITGLSIPALVFTTEDRSDIELLELLHHHGALWQSSFVLRTAASVGRIDVMRWVFDHAPNLPKSMGIYEAAEHGQLAVLQEIYEKCEDITSPLAVAARCGHLDVVKWLASRVENVEESHGLVVGAAANGHLAIVRWLCENLAVQLDDECMNDAAAAGFVDVMAYLHRAHDERPPPHIMDEVIQYNRTLPAMYLLDSSLVTLSFVSSLEDLFEESSETSDLALLLIDEGERAGVKLPENLLEAAVHEGMVTIVSRLCAHRELDHAQRQELMPRAARALRSKRLRE